MKGPLQLQPTSRASGMQPIALTSIAIPGTQTHVRVAWLCGLILFLEGYDIASVGYVIPSLVDTWRIPPWALTQALTAGNIGLMLGSICAGLLGDRLGRKPVLIGCVVTFGMFSLLSAFVGSPMQLASLRFLAGLGLGGGLPITAALASDFAPRSSRARLLILMIMGVPIGFTVGGLLASWLVRLFGWPAIFLTGGMLPLAMAPLLVLRLPDVAQRADRYPNSLAPLFHDGLAPSTVLLWAINAFSLLGVYFMLQWTPALLHSGGVSVSRAILGTTMYAMGTIASPLLLAFLVKRFGMEYVLAWALVFGACCVLGIGLFYPEFWILSLLLFGVGIAGGSQAGIMCLSALVYPPAIRSRGAGCALGAGRVGTITGPLLAGLLLGLGLTAQKLFILAAIPGFITALLTAILARLRAQAGIGGGGGN